MAYKLCTVCKIEKPVDDFYKRTASKDGLSPICKNCRKVYRKNYYAANREASKLKTKEWTRANPDKARKAVTSWVEDNRERSREIKRAWDKRNPQIRIEATRRRQAKIAGATIEKVDYSVILERDNSVCHICKKHVIRKDVHFDHVIPIFRGGDHSYENIKVAHSICNLKKGIN